MIWLQTKLQKRSITPVSIKYITHPKEQFSSGKSILIFDFSHTVLSAIWNEH